MIEFERYPHVNDLLSHYAESLNNQRAGYILKNGVNNKQEAKEFSVFVWRVVDAMYEDEANSVSVLGITSNIEMIPDLEYEVSLYMKFTGFFNVWLENSESA